MQTKTEKLRLAMKKGEVKKALGIAKGFRLGLDSDQRRAIQIAHESMTGKKQFYESLGIDTLKEHKIALLAIDSLL